jgi:hypothetical protein
MSRPKIKVAIDAMGGDDAPREIVKGAIEAAREYGIGIVLVGQPDAIRAELAKGDITGLSLLIEPYGRARAIYGVASPARFVPLGCVANARRW